MISINITADIPGVGEVQLTLESAKKLYSELGQVFGQINNIEMPKIESKPKLEPGPGLLPPVKTQTKEELKAYYRKLIEGKEKQ